MIPIAIIEDDKDIRESLAILLNGTADFKCTQTFDTCEAALEALPVEAPQVILMDINLPGMDGIQGTARFKEILPDTEIIMLTISESDADVFNALCAGACGYLKKNTPPLKLIQSIKEAVNGGAPMSMDVARLVVNSFQPAAKLNDALTTRETEVLRKLCDGHSYKMIANDLFVDINTVKFHIRNIYRKLEVNSKGEAISKALRDKLM